MLSQRDEQGKTVTESTDEEDDEEEEEENGENALEDESGGDEEVEFGFINELHDPALFFLEKIDPKKELSFVTHPVNGQPYSKRQRLLLLVRLDQHFCVLLVLECPCLSSLI